MRSRSYQMKGLYHLALIIISVSALNGASIKLLNVDFVDRLFHGVTIPDPIMPIVICVSAILVLWHNWVD